ncbi:uncharacterized protein LOC141615428 [Silene latifolia]|uniref:uncharacterized protein LOC141615428 n=1 Tax=Silene latifolia TaxID=37657 RepID=UPI003D7755DC
MPDKLQSHGDGCYTLKIGQLSSLEDEFASKTSLSKNGQVSSLEDEFASKASLLDGGGCENFRPTAEDAEDSEETTEDYSDDCDDSDDSEETTEDYQYSSDDNDYNIDNDYDILPPFHSFIYICFLDTIHMWGESSIYLPIYNIKNSHWYICLKDDPPEGCDPRAHHLNLLEQVVGSDAKEVYNDVCGETEFTAVLTDKEHENFIG